MNNRNDIKNHNDEENLNTFNSESLKLIDQKQKLYNTIENNNTIEDNVFSTDNKYIDLQTNKGSYFKNQLKLYFF